MKKPKISDKNVAAYVDYLEKSLDAFNSKRTLVQSYKALKLTIEDINSLMIDGVDLGGVGKKVKIISSESLSSKDDKAMDRVLSFIKGLEGYNNQLVEMEKKILPFIEDEEEFGSEFEEVLLSVKK
ncbi:MAG: hypothetical protein KDC67_14400 [Ignavibacteriae bacterium]|nr:hypothetical protein [Ignavibacteriota bacterium]